MPKSKGKMMMLTGGSVEAVLLRCSVISAYRDHLFLQVKYFRAQLSAVQINEELFMQMLS